jgi:hypothetical protein
MTYVFQMDLFEEKNIGYNVKQIKSEQVYEYLLKIHYAKRIPSISYAYGLFRNGDFVGAITYGTPPSSTLCRGVCGERFQKNVIELNRLVLRDNLKNEATRLIAGSLELLPNPKIIVSFADTEQEHCGIVYQAANFLYTGLSTKFKDPRVRGLEHQHHATYAHGLTNKQVIEKYGQENVYFVERSRKHRYVTFVGNKTEKKDMKNNLRYKILPYPKPNKS